MAAFQYYTGSRPIVSVAGTIPLPIAAADIYAALGPNIVAIPTAADTIRRIVSTQIVLATLPATNSATGQANPEYVSFFNQIQSWMRQLGLYPVGESVGPSIISGF